LLLLEWLNPVQERGGTHQTMASAVPFGDEAQPANRAGKKAKDDNNTFAGHLATMSAELRLLYDDVYSFIMSLGDDINAKELRLYLAFSRLKNFICLLPMKNGLKLWISLPPEKVQLEEGFIRDVRGIGHWGTGDLEMYIRTKEDLAKAKPILERAYQEN
jgi:predicted transport protein